ncbi:hypothetical protein niasHS_009857 [Heterodera schachtii]|uniref:FLYWCH-type domain-containing protein n=1 Tax=Heterodera schachtii TaxID=97005 RepID=A0ABD2JAK5_HETSC
MASKIETKKQQVKLPHGGHLYTFDKMSLDGTTKFWRCEFKNSVNKCKGRIWTDLNNHFIRLATPHTCPANASNVEAQRVKTTIKVRASTTLEQPSVIRSEALQNVPSPAAVLVTKKAANSFFSQSFIVWARIIWTLCGQNE